MCALCMCADTDSHVTVRQSTSTAYGGTWVTWLYINQNSVHRHKTCWAIEQIFVLLLYADYTSLSEAVMLEEQLGFVFVL